MKKKIKGIDYDNEPLTIPDLLSRIDIEYEKRKEELKERQETQRAALKEDIQKERNLLKLLKKAKQIREAMEADFSELEIKAKKDAKKEAEKGVARESQVRAGEVSLKEFHKMGRYDRELSKEIVNKVAGELETASRAIREKNLELLNLEKSLFDCQHKIHMMIIHPGYALLELFKGIQEYGHEQMNFFIAEAPGFDIQAQETQRKIWLTSGKSLGAGQVWESQTVKEARRIAHDPMLPVDLIPSLRDQLEAFEDDATVSVHFYLKEHSVDVNLITPRQKVVTTTPHSEITSIEQKGKKPVTTHKLPAEDRYWDRQKTMKKPAVVTGDVALSEGEESAKKTAEIMAEKKQEEKNG